MRTLWNRGGLASVAMLSVCVAAVAYGQQGQQGQQNQPGQQAGQFQQGQQPGVQGGQAGQPAQQGAFAQAGQQPMQWSPDRLVAHWLIIGNQKEVDLAKFAQERAQNEDVKKFAAMAVEDHTKYINQLQQFAGEPIGAQREQQGQVAQPNAQQGQFAAPQGQQPGQVAQQNRFGHMAGISPLRLKQEIARQEVAACERNLDAKPRSEFDKWFMIGQVMGHQMMLTELQVTRNHATPQLQQVLDQGIQTTQQHLEHAKNLLSQLDKQGKEATAQREGVNR